MTNEQIEKAKDDYAQSIIDSFGRSGVPCGISDIRSMIADGFKAGADFALSRQWVSVEDALPDEHEEVLTYSIASEYAEDENTVAYYDGEDWYTTHGHHIRPNYWMPIPKLNPQIAKEVEG